MGLLTRHDRIAEALRIAEAARYWAWRYREASIRVGRAAERTLATVPEEADDDAGNSG